MTLQLISFPMVTEQGGPFGTTGEGSASLYLVFHVAPALGALAAAARAPLRWRRPAVVAGLLVVAAATGDLVPLPRLMEGPRYTATLVWVEAVVSVVVFAAAVVWARQSGRASSPLHAWIVVHLSLVFYDLVINAAGAERFTPVWWASLSMRAASFAVLAGGSHRHGAQGAAAVRVLHRERAGPAWRSSWARRSTATKRLLSISEGLSVALTEEAVRAQAVTARAVLAGLRGVAGALVRARRHDEPSPGPHELHDRLLWQPGPRPAPPSPPTHLCTLVGLEALASLPNRDTGNVSAHLLVWSALPHSWTTRERDVLAGLAEQVGVALARARAYEQQAAAARTLQASLLPAQLPALPQLELFASYVPGEQGAAVGGDWYDCISVDRTGRPW